LTQNMRVHGRVSAAPVLIRSVRIPSGDVNLDGDFSLPPEPAGVVLFAHGSGSSRFSPRNQYVARTLAENGLGTLLFDLLTPEEEAWDAKTAYLRFDIGLLASRLMDATRWIGLRQEFRDLPIGYFGASTGGAAALVAAAQLGETVHAVVSRGGRPDLAGSMLAQVKSPTLLIVGERDHLVIKLNQQAYTKLTSEKEFKIVPDATHLFEDPGALEEVARLAAAWFRRHLRAP
jgi:putative phosphoribosyl transferase